MTSGFVLRSGEGPAGLSVHEHVDARPARLDGQMAPAANPCRPDWVTTHGRRDARKIKIIIPNGPSFPPRSPTISPWADALRQGPAKRLFLANNHREHCHIMANYLVIQRVSPGKCRSQTIESN